MDSIMQDPGLGVAPAAVKRPRVNLALQGGGSHGAYTWGVLDRLLEDGRVDIEGISGTSSGAVNGALAASGLLTGGREAARERLSRFWRRMSQSMSQSPLQPTWLDRMMGNNNLDNSPVYVGWDLVMRIMSPYQFNPLGINPMRDMLDGLVDFPALHESDSVRLFVAATNVNQGQMKVFAGKELSVECLLATTCLPFLFQAVEIDGEYYWDGGYMGNPTLHPLIHNCSSSDILVVQVTPFVRPSVPTQPTAIVDRMSEISFNATLQRELRSLELVNRLCAANGIDPTEGGVRPVYLHQIDADPAMADYGASSKVNTDWGFLTELRDRGRAAAAGWLDTHMDQLGVASTYAMDCRPA